MNGVARGDIGRLPLKTSASLVGIDTGASAYLLNFGKDDSARLGALLDNLRHSQFAVENLGPGTTSRSIVTSGAAPTAAIHVSIATIYGAVPQVCLRYIAGNQYGIRPTKGKRIGHDGFEPHSNAGVACDIVEVAGRIGQGQVHCGR